MLPYIIGGTAGLLFGGSVCYANYLLARHLLLKDPDKYLVGAVFRQVLNAVALLICFFVGENTPLPSMALLVGAVLGLTVPSLFFTRRLLSLNRENMKKSQSEKEENSNG